MALAYKEGMEAGQKAAAAAAMPTMPMIGWTGLPSPIAPSYHHQPPSTFMPLSAPFIPQQYVDAQIRFD